ncbi:Midasin (Dynein-related AAA-ATPase mdn1) (MIDAS-containing protein), partial [Durusdinium trenchii]
AVLLSGSKREEDAGFSGLAVQRAESIADGIKPTEVVPIRLSRVAFIGPLTVGLAVAAAAFLPPWGYQPIAEETSVTRADPQQVEQARQGIEGLAQALEQQASEAGLDQQDETSDRVRRELERLREIEEELAGGSRDPQEAVTEAAAAATEAAEALEDDARQRELADEALRDALAKLEKTADTERLKEDSLRGAAERLADALESGDLERAAEAAQELQDRSRDADVSESERREAAERLREMAERLDQQAGQEDAPTPDESAQSTPPQGQESEPPPQGQSEPERSEDPQQEPKGDEPQEQREPSSEASQSEGERETSREEQQQAGGEGADQSREAEEQREQAQQDSQEQQRRLNGERQQETGESAESGQRDQGQTESSQSEPAQTEPTGSEPGRPDPSQPETGDQQTTEPQARPGQDPSQPERGQPEPSQSEPGPSEEGQPEQVGEQSGEQPEQRQGEQAGDGASEQAESQEGSQEGEQQRDLSERLRELADRPRDAQQQQEQAEDLRQRAREAFENMSPQEQRELLDRLREQGQEDPQGQEGLMPRGEPGDEPGAEQGQLGEELAGEGEGQPLDARDVDPWRRELMDLPESDASDSEAMRTVAEWFGEGRDAPGDGSSRATEDVLRAARGAQDAIERERVPRRRSELIRKVFQRYAERFAERAPTSSGEQFAFDNAWWLMVAIAAVPLGVMALAAFRTMTRTRRSTAVMARLVLFTLIALALAGVSGIRENDRMAVVVAVDVSGSVLRYGPSDDDGGSPVLNARAFVERAGEARERDDMLGVLAFADQPVPVLSPSSGPVADRALPELGEGGTDIASALNAAAAMIPTDAAGRIILISDGNATTGDELATAERLARARTLGEGARGGLPIDVVPIEYLVQREVLVEFVDAPPRAARGSVTPVRVGLRATAPAAGTLRLLLNGQDIGQERRVLLDAGRSVEPFQVPLPEGRIHRFEAVFEPEEREGVVADTTLANNSGRAFTISPGDGAVLFVRGDGAAQGQTLAQTLERLGLTVERRSPVGVPTDLVEFEAYDLVLLVGVGADEVPQDAQDALATFVTELGGGLIM